MKKNQKLNATVTIGSVLKQSVTKNVGFLKTGLNSVGEEIKRVSRRQRELDAQRKILTKQGKSVKKLDLEYGQLNRTLGRLRIQQNRYTAAAAASRRTMAAGSAMVSGLARNARSVAFASALAGGAIFGVAKQTADLGDNTAKTADKLNIEIGALQELRYAAERSGVASGGFDKSLEKMVKNLGLAAQGTGTQKDALDALGLSANEMIKLSPDQALEVIADKMKGVATQSEKAAIANDLFGRSGVGMLNMLKDGSDGLIKLRDDAIKTGYVLSNQAARDAEKFTDQLLDTSLAFKGIRNTVGSDLMPVITDGMATISNYLLQNRDQTKEWSKSFANSVERAIPIITDVVSGISSIASTTARVVSTVAEMVGGWENFGKVVGTVLLTSTILRVARFGSSVFRMGRALIGLTTAAPLAATAIRVVGAALTANPIGLTIAAIAGGALLIIKNWDTVKEKLAPLFNWMGEKFKWINNSISAVSGFFGFKKKPEAQNEVQNEAQPDIIRPQSSVIEKPLTPKTNFFGFKKKPEAQNEAQPDIIRPQSSVIEKPLTPDPNFFGFKKKPEAQNDLIEPQSSEGSKSIVQNITNNIYAESADAEEIYQIIKDKITLAGNSALFDRPSPAGVF